MLTKYRNVIQDEAGNGLANVTVTVKRSRSNVAAQLYSDYKGSFPLSGNAVLTSSSPAGVFSFYVAEGSYDMTATKAGVVVAEDLDVYVPGTCYVDAKAIGAVGDNSQDDTSALTDAIGAAGLTNNPSAVLLGRGRFKIDGELTSTNPLIRLIGSGIDSTIIRQIDDTANGVNFNYPIIFGQPTGGGLENLTIEAGAGFSSGAFYGDGSSGSAIRVINASDNFSVHNVSAHNFARSAQLLHCWNTRWSNFRGLYAADSALEIDLDGTNIGGGNSFTDFKLSNNGYVGTRSASRGIRLRASGGDFFNTIDATSFGRGVVIDPDTSARQVLYAFFNTVLADTSMADGWDFDGTAGRPVWAITMNNCWGAYSDAGAGARFRGSGVNGIEWNGGRLRENGQHGASLESGINNVHLHDMHIASNGKSAAGTYHGVNAAAGVSNWSVRDSKIGNFASSFNTQQNGVNVASGTGSGFAICDNDLRSNLNKPVNLATTSLDYIISNNLPVGGSAVNVSNAQNFSNSSSDTAAAGSTFYLGALGKGTVATGGNWVASRPGSVWQIYAAAEDAPGAGQSFVYTLMKNGVATGHTVTISGAAFENSAGDAGITLAPTDYFCLRLVTSAGAAVTKHRFMIVVE